MADEMERIRQQDEGDPDAGKKTSAGITAMIVVTAVVIILGAIIAIGLM